MGEYLLGDGGLGKVSASFKKPPLLPLGIVKSELWQLPEKIQPKRRATWGGGSRITERSWSLSLLDSLNLSQISIYMR